MEEIKKLAKAYYDLTNEIEEADAELAAKKAEKKQLGQAIVEQMLNGDEPITSLKFDFGSFSLIQKSYYNVLAAHERSVLDWASECGIAELEARRLDKDAFKAFCDELPKDEDRMPIFPPELSPHVKLYEEVSVRLTRKK